MSLCKHCVSGVTHEGIPEGKIETIGGIRCYVATPTIDFPKGKVILFLPDAFGIDLINGQLLVDDFAKNGFKVVAIDYYNGDPIPPDALNSGTFDLAGWLKKHGPEETRPALDKVITALKEQGVTAFGSTGYCFGGRYTFDLAFDQVIKVAVVSHPSLLKIPEDFEKYNSIAKAPLLINSATFDEPFNPEAQSQADAILGGGSSSAPGYKRKHFDDCAHGFAIRGDMSDPKVKAGKEGAFKATVEFFMEHL